MQSFHGTELRNPGRGGSHGVRSRPEIRKAAEVAFTVLYSEVSIWVWGYYLRACWENEGWAEVGGFITVRAQRVKEDLKGKPAESL